MTVSNVPPTVTVAPLAANENDLATLSGTITDPGVLDSFEVLISFGDGSDIVTLSLPAGATSFNTNHRYLDDDPTGTPSDTYGVSVTVTDDDGGVGTANQVVTINNVVPVVTINEVRDGTGPLIEDERVVFIHDPAGDLLALGVNAPASRDLQSSDPNYFRCFVSAFFSFVSKATKQSL